MSDFAGSFSGRVSYDDETWGDFIVQYVDGAFIPDGGDPANFTHALTVDSLLVGLEDMFSANSTGSDDAIIVA